MKLARRGVDDRGRGKNPNEKQCRRRRWSDADKRRIVSESLAPGSQVTEVARRNGVGREQLSVWRRQARVAPVAAAPMFALGLGGTRLSCC
jgi:transposase-like protein